jgi:hypothetical protein
LVASRIGVPQHFAYSGVCHSDFEFDYLLPLFSDCINLFNKSGTKSVRDKRLILGTVPEKRRRMVHLNGTYQLPVYDDDINLLGDNTYNIKKNTESLIDASKEVGLEVKTEN